MEKEREIDRSKTETQNTLSLLTNPNLFLQDEEEPYSLFQYPQTLSLALLTNPNLFLQEYSIPSIQATSLFFNSIFFQFKIHVFVSCSLYYWIPQIFFFFLKNQIWIDLCVCVCVYGEWYRFGGVCVAISGLDGSQARVRLRSEGAIKDLQVLGSDPSDTTI